MDQTQNHANAPQTKPTDEMGEAGGKPSFWRHPVVIILGVILLGLALFFGLRYLAESLTHESTDDAFLDANIVSIAPKVAGRMKQVYVQHNQRVKAGELLVELDPRDFQVQLDQKRAAVKAAQANVESLKANVELFRSQIATALATAKQSAAEVAAAQANAEKAQSDLKRAEDLFKDHTISPQELDAAKTTAAWTEANLKAAQEKAASDESKVTQAKAQLEAGLKAEEQAEAQTHQAEWEVEAAELNLSYTRVTAPGDGYITRKSVENGDYVQLGQKLMALVPPAFFVTANFKETQLPDIHTNQPVSIRIDSVPGHRFAGHIDSIQAGSGARFSLLPPENAVGNYVKVVQRVPVKILFEQAPEAGHVLGPGESVVPSVLVTDYEISEGIVALVAGAVAVLTAVLWWWLARR